MANSCSRQLEDERNRRVAAVEAFNIAVQSTQDLRNKLKDEEKVRKSADLALESTQKQAEDQKLLFHKAEDQLATAKRQIQSLKKKLEGAVKAKDIMEKAKDEAVKARAEAEKAREQAKETKERAEQEAYEMGVAETETNLKSQVLRVCRLYCSQVWAKALNQAGVEALFELRRAENVYYPPAIQQFAPASSEADTTSEAVEAGQDSATNAPTPLDKPAEETEHPRVLEKEKIINRKVPQDVMKPPTNPQALLAEKEAPEKMELVLASLVKPIKAVPPSQDSEASDTASQQPSKDKLTIKLKKQAVFVYLHCCCCFFSFSFLGVLEFFVMKLPFL